MSEGAENSFHILKLKQNIICSKAKYCIAIGGKFKKTKREYMIICAVLCDTTRGYIMRILYNETQLYHLGAKCC